MYEIEPAQEIPGWGQIPDHVMDDAVVWARQALEAGGPAAAFCYLPELRYLLPTWRGTAAADLIVRIELGHLPISKDIPPQWEPAREVPAGTFSWPLGIPAG